MSYLYQAIKQLCIIAYFRLAVLYFISLHACSREILTMSPAAEALIQSLSSERLQTAPDFCQCHAEAHVMKPSCCHRNRMAKRVTAATGEEETDLGGGQCVWWQAKVGHR